MRPDLGDLIAGVQRLLQTEIVPALSDPFLQEQAAYASLLLECCRKSWVGEHLAVAAEHDDLRTTLGAMLEGLVRWPDEPAAELAAASRAALAAMDVVVSQTSLDVVLAADRDGRGCIERAIALLDGLAGSAAQTDPARSMRASIDAYLVRHAERRHAALAMLGIGW